MLLGDAASVTEGAAATDEVSNAGVTARGAATTGVVAIGAVLIATSAACWASAAGAALGVAGARDPGAIGLAQRAPHWPLLGPYPGVTDHDRAAANPFRHSRNVREEVVPWPAPLPLCVSPFS